MKNNSNIDLSILEATVDSAVRQIPPLWPLASQVAVNPFLGQTTDGLAEAGARLARVGGISLVMPNQWYRDRIASGEISDRDLAEALAASPHAQKPVDIDALKTAASETRQLLTPLPTIADLAANASGTDWPGVIAERIGSWAGGYFDRGQALWSAPRGKNAWLAFCGHATHDLTTEIIGLTGFAAFVADAPENPMEAIARATRRLGISAQALDSYFHQLLFSLGGWAQFARYELWKAELGEDTDLTIADLLAIRLLWEEALFDRYESEISENWQTVCHEHERPVAPSEAEIVGAVLQEAAERAAQRGLAETLMTDAIEPVRERSALQAVFCIDVRSEVFRRSLETVNSSIRTFGFAGFFGVFAKHRRFASDTNELRLPVLLNPTVTTSSGGPEDEGTDKSSRFKARATRAWGRFKLAAVSSFAFVEAMGPVYVGKLVRDALGFNGKPGPTDPAPRFNPEAEPKARIEMAATVLRAMSLTSDFSRLVLLVGHGANVVNNPHASSLHCGACGGYSGDVNARLLASLLNDRNVRAGLVDYGITIPDDVLFVAALHDTTTDRVTLFDGDKKSKDHKADLDQARRWLAEAGKITRTERALRLPGARRESDIAARSRNWAEVRPEWALAGCKFFVAASRGRTTNRNLGGHAFLHDYDSQPDGENGFEVLELIMTAPVVVASWISLQYYGSTVAPDTFGSGNKLLHNVVGGFGVFEGNGGLLRGGLPWQSVHDGKTNVHDPLRLSVCIEAPIEAMNNVLNRHPDVRALFDNRWLHLLQIDNSGALAYRYVGNRQWESVGTPPSVRQLDAVA